jgi:hypothetical protein
MLNSVYSALVLVKHTMRACVSRADLIFEYEWRPIQVTWHQSDVGFTAEQVKVCWNTFRAHIIR